MFKGGLFMLGIVNVLEKPKALDKKNVLEKPKALDEKNVLEKPNVLDMVNVQINGTTHRVEKEPYFRLPTFTGDTASTYLLFRNSWSSAKL